MQFLYKTHFTYYIYIKLLLVAVVTEVTAVFI